MNSRTDLQHGPAWQHRLRHWAQVLIYLARAVVLRFREGRCLQVAGSLTFTTLLALVPLVTLVAVVFSRLPQSVRFGEVLRGFLLENLLPDRAGRVIAGYALQFSQKATNLTIVGVVMLVLTAIMLMNTIDQVINQIWQIRSRRPWATRLAGYWVALSLGPVLLAGAVLAASAVIGLSLDLMNEPPWLELVALQLLPVGILTGVFATLYYAVPHCTVHFRDAACAGFLAALGFVVMQRLFGFYLASFPGYTLIYGAFAAVPIFLVWLYLSWSVVLLGAVLAAVLPERSLAGRPLAQVPGRRMYLALLVAAALVQAQREGRWRGVGQLARFARVGHEEVRQVLQVCEQAGLVVRRQQGGWLLVRAATEVSLQEWVRLFGWRLPVGSGVGMDPLELRVRAVWGGLLGEMDALCKQPLSVLDGASAPEGGPVRG